MNTIKKIKYYCIAFIISALTFGCNDHVAEIEDLPNPDLAFNYSVADDTYQLDYYVGANVKFVSHSKATGTCNWDFGDGSTATGNTVTHKYAVAGTYNIKLSMDGVGSLTHTIFISDIKPILSLQPFLGEYCEVQSTYIGFNVELPNPEKLSEEYVWTFPDGTLDESGASISFFNGKDPGEIKFSNVGSQVVRLQVKLGGRTLEDGVLNVPVAFNTAVPTLYYATKSGNIMALKLASNIPQGMKINPFDMGVKSGQHPLNILYNDSLLYILDCGRQFTYVDDTNGNLGDGRITVMSKDGKKVETMLTNTGTAYNDPFFGYIEGSTLYFTDRNTGIGTINLSERNRSMVRSDFPYLVENARLGYYGQGWSYGSISACIGKINNVWYWCKTYNGTGIFRFLESDILKDPIAGNGIVPTSGIALESMLPKSFVWDSKNQVIYFTVYDTGYEGLYRCSLDQLNLIKTRDALKPYQCKFKDGKTVTPIAATGKGEGSDGEYIGISQLALDSNDGSVYFGLRSGDAAVPSGLMRYNPASGYIEYVVQGVEVYGVSVNNKKSKLF